MKYFLLTLLLLPLFTQAQTTGVSVDLIWEADTYVPSFYQGHSQIAPASTVRIVALPAVSTGSSINQVKVGDFRFQWEKDGQVVSNASGVGQNVLLYKAATEEANTIKVTISNPITGDVEATKQLVLPVSNPRLVFYREDPLAGTEYHHALSSNFNLNKSEITVRAEPYFFSRGSVQGGQLSYLWSINNKKIISNTSDQQLVTFASPSQGSGQNQVQLEVNNLGSAFQSAKNLFQITFNQQQVSF
jgi:hypothetical protein